MTAIADRASCRLYLATPPELVSGGTRLRDLLDRLPAALTASDAACLLIDAPDDASADAIGVVAKPLIEIAQAQGVAALLPGRAELAKRIGADGTHLDLRAVDNATAVNAYREARRILGDGAIVGTLCPAERHAAMELAELGAEYIGFDASAEELIGWWAEVMTTPSVAFAAADPEQARRLAGTGADFIAVEPQGWNGVDAATPLETFRTAIQAS